MTIEHILIAFLLLNWAMCKTIFLSLIPQNAASYTCLKQSGINEIILPVQRDIGDFEVQSVINAKNSGLNTHILFTPCRDEGPKDIVAKLIAKISPKII